MHATEFEALLDAHKRWGCLPDANLLLVYATGQADPEVDRFKRTSAYTRQDFELIRSIVSYFDRRVTTPNILTEVSNLLDHGPAHLRGAAFNALRDFAVAADEVYVGSSMAAEQRTYVRLGISDTVTILASGRDPSPLVLTADLDLFLGLSDAGRACVNYNHVRSYRFLD